MELVTSYEVLNQTDLEDSDAEAPVSAPIDDEGIRVSREEMGVGESTAKAKGKGKGKRFGKTKQDFNSSEADHLYR